MMKIETLSMTTLAAVAMAACQQGGSTSAEGSGVEAGMKLRETEESSVENVEVVATVKAWPGDAFIKKEVSPVRVTIENESDNPLDVSYRRFRLVEDDGDARAALPPFQIEGAAPEARVGAEYEVIDYDWVGTEYDVYDVYDPLYGEDVVVYDEDWVYEPDYYVDHYTYWADTTLPTAEMLVLALPEGVVKPGGKIVGWMYFEEVDAMADAVTFEAEIVDAKSGEKIGEAKVELDETLLM